MNPLRRQTGLETMRELAHVFVVRCILQSNQIMHGLHEHRCVAGAQIEWAAGDERIKPLQIDTHRLAMFAQSSLLARFIHIIQADDSFNILEVIQSINAQIGVVAEFTEAEAFQLFVLKRCFAEHTPQALANASVAVAKFGEERKQELQFGRVECFSMHQFIQRASAVDDPLCFLGQ